MKQILTWAAAFILLAMSCIQSSYAICKEKEKTQKEALTYDVYFHMGFIWAKAGRGVLSFYDEKGIDDQPRLHGQLAAKSLSVVEHIMKVRDTLDCWMSPQYLPIEYCKKTNEGSYRAVERNYVTTTLKAGETIMEPSRVDSSNVEIRRWRNKKGNDSRLHSVKAPAYDMLSVFYAIRKLDFDKMKTGEAQRFAIFTGVKQQWMSVQFRGAENCKLRNGTTHKAWRLELTFATKDQDTTPLQVWLARTPDHRPLKVIIQLKRIGSVQGEIVE